jgi:hypothetical protein
LSQHISSTANTRTLPIERHYGWIKSLWKWGFGPAIGLIVGLIVGFSLDDVPLAKQSALPSMTQCVGDALGLLGPKSPQTAETLRAAREHCYSLIQAEGVLNDFNIRRLDFFQQYRANGVLMWMVVAVTLAGVLLAGVQLGASYQLAIANKTSLDAKEGELILKRDQLALKSSVTGLFILIISFCFFLVFVLNVYRLESLEDRTNLHSPSVATMPMGELGPPSPTKDKP